MKTRVRKWGERYMVEVNRGKRSSAWVRLYESYGGEFTTFSSQTEAEKIAKAWLNHGDVLVEFSNDK